MNKEGSRGWFKSDLLFVIISYNWKGREIKEENSSSSFSTFYSKASCYKVVQLYLYLEDVSSVINHGSQCWKWTQESCL